MAKLYKKASFEEYWKRAKSYSKLLDASLSDLEKDNDLGYAVYDTIFHMVEFYARALLFNSKGVIEGSHRNVFLKFKEEFESNDKFKKELIDFYEKICDLKDAINYRFFSIDEEIIGEHIDYSKKFENRVELYARSRRWL